jgi:DNA-binding NtrC family response regulator
MQKQLEPAFLEDTSMNGESTSDKSIRRLRLLVADLISEVESLDCGGSKSTDQSTPLDTGASINFDEEIKRFEMALIKSALHRTCGHQARAAVLLNLNSSTLNAKIRQYNIDVHSVIQLTNSLSH